MAIKKYEGNVLIMVATAATQVGDIIEFGTDSVGVAQTAGEIGEKISVEVVGVYEVPATTAEAFAVGDIASWDNATSAVLIAGTTTMGMVWEGKGAGEDSPILVKIG